MPRILPVTIFAPFFFLLLLLQCSFCRLRKFESSYELMQFEANNTQDTVKLECKFWKNKLLGRSSPSSVDEVYWEHKKCGIGLDLIPCHLAENIPWHTVMCKNQSKVCDVFSLKLKNLTKNSSGLYRCNVKNYIDKEFKTFKVFELDVVDPKEDIRILDERHNLSTKNNVDFDNQTVYINGTALFRCRVQSLLSIDKVFWGKLPSPEMEVSADEKCNNFKILMETQRQDSFISTTPVKVDRTLYIAKLRLNSAKPYDSGTYLCIAGVSTAQGFIVKCKTIYLKVISPELFPGDDSSATSLLWLLIFIPIFIVFIAVIICVCHVHVYGLKGRKISTFYK